MNCFKVLTRKKVLDPLAISETRLARVLNTFDLTALGVGSTLGVGVYVLAGHVARDTAGPAVVISFLIAAIASVFAGLCYAEFGSRVPRAGSAYVYSYVCVGEFIAFVIGWNLILEYVIGSASVARGLSLYLDTLINNTLQDTFREIAPMNVSFMSAYFDFFSCGLAIVLSIALGFGMKESSRVNNVFTGLNIFVVLFVIVVGSLNAKTENWNLPAPSNSTFGTGGFLPYGISGVIKGAATCFYGFVGFDCIATTGEEVKNPQRAIPLSIITSLMIIFLAYFGTATVVTLMVPYYDQDINAPIPHAFAEINLEWAKWIVAIGGIFGLCASLFGAMFPLPRVIYAMASDGIIFRFLGNINPRFHTPLHGTLSAGLLTGLMSALFDLKQLVNMMSIGTLLAYTIVAACVMLLRYADDEDREYAVATSSNSDGQTYTENPEINALDSTDSTTELVDSDERVTFCGLIKQTFNFQKLQYPTKTSQTLVAIELCIFALLCLILGLCVMYLKDELKHARIWAIILVSILGLLMILLLMSISTQPNSKKEVRFKVPLVPLIPALSILVNIYLMLMLDVNTWIRFGIWMALGLPIYFISVCCVDTSLSNSSYPKMHAKVNGTLNQTNQSNGHVNPHLTIDNEVENNEEYQKKEEHLVLDKAFANHTSDFNHQPNASSPPVETNHSSPDNLSVHGALAALDDVLSKEELVAYNPSFDRKMSSDTTSTVSNTHFEESVVALIHHEDHSPILEEQIEENDLQSLDDSTPNDVSLPKEDQLNLTTQHSNNDKEEDKEVELSYIPPPPPPPPPPCMEGFETFIPRIPRVSLRKNSKDDAHHTLLKPNLAPVELNRSNSDTDLHYRNDSYDDNSRSSPEEGGDVNVIIGSEKYQNLASKLNKLLVRHSLGLPSPSKLTKPEVIHESEDNSQKPVSILPGMKHVVPEHSRDDDLMNEMDEPESAVVEEVMKPADIKKKLNEILRSDPRLTMRPLKSNIAVSSIIEQSQTNDDINNGTEDGYVPSNEDKNIMNEQTVAQLQHKDLMSNTLKSIRLRKVDSFKRD